MDTISTVCVWVVMLAGIVAISAVVVVAVASAVHLVRKLSAISQMELPQGVQGVQGKAWQPRGTVEVPVEVPPLVSGVPGMFQCSCGNALTLPIKSEVVDGKAVLVYKCTCGKTTKV